MPEAKSLKQNEKSTVSKELRSMANDFLNSRKYANNLVDILTQFEENLNGKQQVGPFIVTTEVIFLQLIKRKELDKEADITDEALKIYHNWLIERYNENWSLLMRCLNEASILDAKQALKSSMKVLSASGKDQLHLKELLKQLLCPINSKVTLIQQLHQDYSQYLDISFSVWKLLPELMCKASFKNEIFALNYLELVNAFPVTDDLHKNKQILCVKLENSKEKYTYFIMRHNINVVWKNILSCRQFMSEATVKQSLILLLERILPHLEKPILLTDFLMDSLDYGGAISLLALQGLFTLMQKHNITYPQIYEKLYSLFEAEIFYTKYKARLFYLADIFLSSTYLPEGLVAAFVKRLARLSLNAPPQDAIVILHFIGNLFLRHISLKRLVSARTPTEVTQDPYDMNEKDPAKSKALDSSLWEIVMLQNNAIPSVASAARSFLQKPPKTEFDLANVLEITESDIFDKEIQNNNLNENILAFERPQSLFLSKNDQIQELWELF